jgi:hypothetical protein
MPYTYKTWTLNEVVSTDDMNLYLRDNLEYIYYPQTDINTYTESELSTTSASFADVGAAFSGTVYPSNTAGTTTLLVTSTFTARPNTAAGLQGVNFDLMLNGTSITGGSGICAIYGNGNQFYPVGINYWIENVPTGTAVVKLRWKVSGGTATIFGGSATYGGVAQFAVREVS